MQTSLQESFRNTFAGQEAETILRKCVHCGFCNATCPTYQLLGDEADGPRGRIYQIKEMLEGAPVSQLTRQHLDRCLLCRACETTCPSGVNYSRLYEIAGEFQQQAARPVLDRLRRWLVQAVLPYPPRVRLMVKLATVVKAFLPDRLHRQLPEIQHAQQWPDQNHPRKVILHEGCIQSVVEPNINVATAKVLDSVGISIIRTAPVACCGALHQHLSSLQQARTMARANIDQWWPHITAGAEAIVSNASGCGMMLQDYPQLLKDDVDYAEKARIVADRSHDIVQLIQHETIHLNINSDEKVVFQSPCSLQHGLQLSGEVERLLLNAGINLVTPEDSHLCCGQAGSYSLLQSAISEQLLDNKLKALSRSNPDYILTANIGCLLHMKASTTIAVMHWIEYIEGKLESVVTEGK
ncbi:MAG TPA: glycolate oxidase subunit GlcF [Crenotrichaceae bacterium]|nr:glycolate oxidase subunit GlcF [Crenotrichaceae bacterium]